jgi:hypothetical protein
MWILCSWTSNRYSHNAMQYSDNHCQGRQTGQNGSAVCSHDHPVSLLLTFTCGATSVTLDKLCSPHMQYAWSEILGITGLSYALAITVRVCVHVCVRVCVCVCVRARACVCKLWVTGKVTLLNMPAIATENSYYFILIFHNMFRPLWAIFKWNTTSIVLPKCCQYYNRSDVFVLSTYVVRTTLILIYSFIIWIEFRLN